MILEPYRFARFTGFIHFKELRNTSGYSNYRIYELLVSSKFLGNGVSSALVGAICSIYGKKNLSKSLTSII
ncbi:hypothetical protein [Clostridium arbusti]|uniref:hypothetical protein n=1 Tax=Clostridium arbusti TaxID=1137848 RepID=UPI00028A123D|nr:hypothetical protein [Clostridium arbusti]